MFLITKKQASDSWVGVLLLKVCILAEKGNPGRGELGGEEGGGIGRK